MPGVERSRQTEYVSSQLLVRSASLVRLLAKELHGPLSRSEASLLNTASGTPRRITELADLEGLAQPTTTLLVKRLEQHGLVTREREPGRDVERVAADGVRASGRHVAVDAVVADGGEPPRLYGHFAPLPASTP